MSAEIVAITLGIVAEAPLLNQILISRGSRFWSPWGLRSGGVIVKLDDMGYWLAENVVRAQGWVKGLDHCAPCLMKVLSIVGTLAMFLVGGGIVVHGIAPLHHAIEHWSAGLGGVMASTLPVVANLVLGFIIGAVVLAGVKAVSSLRGAGKSSMAKRSVTAPRVLPENAPGIDRHRGADVAGLRNVLREKDG